VEITKAVDTFTHGINTVFGRRTDPSISWFGEVSETFLDIFEQAQRAMFGLRREERTDEQSERNADTERAEDGIGRILSNDLVDL
jgi:hypothetical protein